MKFLSKNIRYLRNKEKWSQEELAAKLDVKRSSIAAYESKNVNPKLEFIVAFSKLFDISISDLLEKDLEHELDKATNGSEEQAKIQVEPSHVRLEHLAEGPQPEDSLDIDDKESVRHFIRRSIRIRKMLEGFKAFYRFKLESLSDNGQDPGQLAADVQNFIMLMEHLVAHNESIMRAIARRQEIDWKL